MTAQAARDAARRKLGNATLREEIYQINTLTLVDSAWRDLENGCLAGPSYDSPCGFSSHVRSSPWRLSRDDRTSPSA